MSDVVGGTEGEGESMAGVGSESDLIRLGWASTSALAALAAAEGARAWDIRRRDTPMPTAPVLVGPTIV